MNYLKEKENIIFQMVDAIKAYLKMASLKVMELF